MNAVPSAVSRGHSIPGAAVTGTYELPHMGPGNPLSLVPLEEQLIHALNPGATEQPLLPL